MNSRNVEGWLGVLITGKNGTKRRKVIINGQLYKGWLIHDFTKIRVTGQFGNYYYIETLEGRYRGEKMAMHKSKAKFLVRNFKPLPPVNIYLKYSKSSDFGLLRVIGLDPIVNVTVGGLDFKKNGTYKIQIAVEKHPNADIYLKDSVHAETWFRIDDPFYPNNNRFLHIGSASAGCVTITDKKVWNQFYRKLVKSRLDNQYIGYLHVEIYK